MKKHTLKMIVSKRKKTDEQFQSFKKKKHKEVVRMKLDQPSIVLQKWIDQVLTGD